MNRKVLLSIMIIAAMLVLIAGATYAVFSDQVMSDIQSFETGTVNINVGGQEETFETTFHFPQGYKVAPGDSNSQLITINNTGNLDVIYTVYIDYTWGDPQPDIWRCDPPNSMHAWAEDSTGDEVGVLAPGGNEPVTLYVELPMAASNACQGLSGDLRVTVHAVQERNIDPDFTCIKLVYKDLASQWLPYGPEITEAGNWKGQHGNLCYETDDNGDLRVVVNAYGLTPDAYYQLALNGQGGCSNPEGVIFAGLGADQYHSGWSSGSTTALANTCSNTWDEGVYNFYGTDGQVQADSNGDFSLDYAIDGSNPNGAALPSSTTFNNVKFIVKEITSTGAPSHTNHGSNWQPMLMEIRALNFTTGP
jgi:predicted ribosomally synthesized peptide with SipW-like signal peptide